MSAETFVCYWIGEEPTPPSPTLGAMPAFVDVVPLAFVTIDSTGGDYLLDFGFLCKTHPAPMIQRWIKEVRARGAKVLLSINDEKIAEIPSEKLPAFVANVVQNVRAWGVDGLDLDYEPTPFTPHDGLLEVTAALRAALPDAMITAPIWEPWTDYPQFLNAFAAKLDLVTTMDYTGYPGLDATIELFNSYAAAIGSTDKLAIGVSCMGPPPPKSNNFTPLKDVVKLCHWEPAGTRKAGVMLYTFSYDVEVRKGGGTGYPDGTFTKTIHEQLP